MYRTVLFVVKGGNVCNGIFLGGESPETSELIASGEGMRWFWMGDSSLNYLLVPLTFGP